MWTVPDNETHARPQQPDTFPKSEISSQLPHLSWGRPTLGLHGAWCYGNQTNLQDVIKVRVSAIEEVNSRVLDFTPVRHFWTPAGIETYFRSLPSGAAGVYPFAGLLTIKERKCITPDNVFVSELTLINDSRDNSEYKVEVVTPHFTKNENGSLQVKCELIPGGLNAKIRIDSPAALIIRGLSSENSVSIPRQASAKIRISFAIDAEFSPAQARAESELNYSGIFEKNEDALNAWFERNVPALQTPDLDFLKLYYYRWFLVYRNWHNPRRVIPEHPYRRAAFYESPIGSWFGCVIGLSVPIQIVESTWLRDPQFGANHIRNWAEPVDPEYRNYIQFTPHAISRFARHHDDANLLRETYPALKKYVEAKLNPDDRSQLPVQAGSWMSGAEYQPNFYQFTTPKWDWRHDVQGHRKWNFPLSKMIRLDNAAFTIANVRAAAEIADAIGCATDARDFSSIAQKLTQQLTQKHWDENTQLFYAAEPQSGALSTEAACYDSFAPFLWKIVSDSKYFAAFEKFFDPQWFWSEFPITTVAKNSPMYWSGNCLTGPTEASEAKPHQYTCSWNGPAWHFSNSLMAEALGAAAATPGGENLRPRWLDFMTRWGEMHFLYGDRTVPCAIEHVRPTDGARFRCIPDYFHSAWIDPFMRYWAGINIDVSTREIRFEPFTTAEFELRGVPILGHEMCFLQQRRKGILTKYVSASDGRILAENSASPVTFKI